MTDWRRSPGQGRYARSERERRFVVSGSAPASGSGWLIEDRYVDGTTLRLRRLTVDGESVFKLTQKVRAAAGDPFEVATTNTYLSAEEHALLATLPAAVLRKTRRPCVWQGRTYAVDELHGELTGLVLAECEVESLEAPLDLPSWLGPEVSGDDRFSGGSLARATPAEVAALLASLAQGYPPRGSAGGAR